jgi:hypothetical protein
VSAENSRYRRREENVITGRPDVDPDTSVSDASLMQRERRSEDASSKAEVRKCAWWSDPAGESVHRRGKTAVRQRPARQLAAFERWHRNLVGCSHLHHGLGLCSVSFRSANSSASRYLHGRKDDIRGQRKTRRRFKLLRSARRTTSICNTSRSCSRSGRPPIL